MRCYTHTDADAIGTCKSCQRGLCTRCAVDVEPGLACRDKCETAVRELNRLTDWSVRLMESPTHGIPSVRSVARRAALFNLALGVVFLGWGALRTPRLWFLIAIGACFLAFGVYELLKRQGVENSVDAQGGGT
jgi:hypothetical protein